MSRDGSSLAVLAEVEVSAVGVDTLESAPDDAGVASVAHLDKRDEKEGRGQTRRGRYRNEKERDERLLGGEPWVQLERTRRREEEERSG